MDDRVLHDFLVESIPLWQQNPVQFFEEVLFFYPDEWQKEAAFALRDNPKVTIKSGQGVGKTGFEAATLLWFLSCFENARVVATAPTLHQLNDVLWAEVSKWQSKSPLLKEILQWTKTKISMIGSKERWYAVARTATTPENMQGFHEDNMLFIVDEASGVADPIMEAILGTLTGANNKLLLWFMDNIEVPLANLCGHGDVKIARRSVIEECCQKAGLKVESCEIRKGMRMHCVVRKV